MDLIFTAMNAHEILDYDGLKFQRECGLDLYSNECLWNSQLWWTKISDKHSGLTFTEMNAHEIIGQALSLWHAMI